ncbi:MAG TPA: DUF5302 family protein [Acidothermaceae bacterium]|jgi:hypothetical protein
MATADPDQSPSADESESPEATASADDELRLRYREALERKRAGGSAAATGHGADRPNAPTSNDKVKRTFRRRAGG